MAGLERFLVCCTKGTLGLIDFATELTTGPTKVRRSELVEVVSHIRRSPYVKNRISRDFVPCITSGRSDAGFPDRLKLIPRCDRSRDENQSLGYPLG